MTSDGYTLVEMLIALAVVGMTAAGLAEGAYALNRIQGQAMATLKREEALARLESRFAAFLEGRGPFRSDDKPASLEGSADQLQFPCGEATCTAELIAGRAGMSLDLEFEDGTDERIALPGVLGASFAYDDGKTEQSAWPPSDQGRQLKSVTVLGGFEPDQHPLATARLDLDQAPDCEFDAIIKDCRAKSNEPG